MAGDLDLDDGESLSKACECGLTATPEPVLVARGNRDSLGAFAEEKPARIHVRASDHGSHGVHGDPRARAVVGDFLRGQPHAARKVSVRLLRPLEVQETTGDDRGG